MPAKHNFSQVLIAKRKDKDFFLHPKSFTKCLSYPLRPPQTHPRATCHRSHFFGNSCRTPTIHIAKTSPMCSERLAGSLATPSTGPKANQDLLYLLHYPAMTPPKPRPAKRSNASQQRLHNRIYVFLFATWYYCVPSETLMRHRKPTKVVQHVLQGFLRPI